MPKFLDAPSWYDDDGNLKTIQGTYTIAVLGGWGSTIEVPYVGGANKEYLSHISGRTLVGQGNAFGQIPYWQNGSVGFQNIAAGVEGGQVLTWNSSSTPPSWKGLSSLISLTTTKLYCHNIQMWYSYSATTYYNIVFSFFSTRSTAYTTSTLSTMRSDIYSQYANNDDVAYILAAGFAQGVDSVSMLKVTSSSFTARVAPMGGDEYAITSVTTLYDKYFAVLSSVSLNT